MNSGLICLYSVQNKRQTQDQLFMTRFALLLLKLTSQNTDKNVVITADRNLDLIEIHKQEIRQFLDLLVSYGFFSLVKQPTQPASQRCLDIIITKIKGTHIAIRSRAFSDHFMVIANTVQHPKVTYITRKTVVSSFNLLKLNLGITLPVIPKYLNSLLNEFLKYPSSACPTRSLTKHRKPLHNAWLDEELRLPLLIEI